jgi:hypothetical protein
LPHGRDGLGPRGRQVVGGAHLPRALGMTAAVENGAGVRLTRRCTRRPRGPGPA